MTNTTPSDADHPHYPRGASSAKQWRTCHGSIALTDEARAKGLIPEDTETEYSKEGTEAHDWADRCLKGEISRKNIPASFREHLDGYLDLAEELAESNGGTVYNEQLVPLFYNTEAHGTLDYAVVSVPQVDILDLKYGAGVWVDAEENDQLIIYALSLMENLGGLDMFSKKTKVNMHIYQPRHRDFDGSPTIFSCTYEDLMDYKVDIAADYEKSKAAKPTDLTPSADACQFCDARRICKARVTDLFDGIMEEANPVVGEVDTEAAGELITPEVRLRIFEKAKEITKFFEDTNNDTMSLIESGVHIPGLKTIEGRPGNRKWANEEDAAKLLRNIPAAERYKPKQLISPTQAEKVLKKVDEPLEAKSTKFKNRWNELVTRPDGKPKLALESDPKPARVPVASQFEEELTDDDCL